MATRQRHRLVALSVSPTDNPYAHVDIRGEVVDLVGGEEAERHIHRLHRKNHDGAATRSRRASGG